MKTYSFLLFYFMLNIAAWMLNLMGILPGAGMALDYNAQTLITWFDFTNIQNTLTGLGIGIGFGALVGLITRQYVYAAGATVIWSICMMFKPLQDVVNGIPNLVRTFLDYPEYTITSGFTLGDMFALVLQGFTVFMLFMFIMEMASSRQIT